MKGMKLNYALLEKKNENKKYDDLNVLDVQ